MIKKTAPQLVRFIDQRIDLLSKDLVHAGAANSAFAF